MHVVLAFPLLLAVLFPLSMSLVWLLRGPREFRYSAKVGEALYLVFLAALFAAVTVGVSATGRLGRIWGPGFGGLWESALWFGVSTIIGWILFRFDLAAARRVHTLALSSSLARRVVARGLRPSSSKSFPVLLSMALATATMEEIIWRGFLIGALRETYLIGAVPAILIGGVAFSLHHLYFGATAVVTKAMWGVVWGSMFLMSGHIVVPVLSHCVFNLAVVLPAQFADGSDDRSKE